MPFKAWKRQKQNRPANIRLVGLKRIGPMPLEGKRVVTEENQCPFQTILDLDNSYLYMSTRTKNACIQTRWFGTRYRYRHADELGTNRHSIPRYDPAQISSEFRGRQRQFMSAASKQWTSSQDIQLAMSRAAEIRAGHREGTDLVILDIEFNRCGQVKGIALVEYISGRVLLDTLVKSQVPLELSQ